MNGYAETNLGWSNILRIVYLSFILPMVKAAKPLTLDACGSKCTLSRERNPCAHLIPRALPSLYGIRPNLDSGGLKYIVLQNRLPDSSPIRFGDLSHASLAVHKSNVA